MIKLPKKLLVIEGYDPAGMAKLEEFGATRASVLYKRMLGKYVDQRQIDVSEMSGTEPPEIDMDQYAGICWTGSNLFFSETDHVVQRHIEWCQKFFEAGIPQIGSCWGVQLAAVAAGGKCASNPKGREFGIGRKIMLTEAGRSHSMYAGKNSVFDGFESHADIVTELPEGATLLAGNIFTPVQALDVKYINGTFWAFQYHPEYDFSEIAALALVRQDGLIEQGSFKDRSAVVEFAEEMNALQIDPLRLDIKWKWGIDNNLADPEFRTREVKNWVHYFFGATSSPPPAS
ncbi:MAG: type 1 glutamine amidotransferase [Sphingomonadales bacterium]|nr:type 1 glutamine amidotransferase [Sphingomonadales bacterium]